MVLLFQMFDISYISLTYSSYISLKIFLVQAQIVISSYIVFYKKGPLNPYDNALLVFLVKLFYLKLLGFILLLKAIYAL